MKSDLEIARETPMQPLADVASRFGLPTERLTYYGPYKAKVDHRLGLEGDAKTGSRYVLVTAITPTPAGEGKTVHTIGLSLALNRIGKSAVCTIRQPSMGPVFGIKGGAAGGGHSQVIPMEDFNLHLTGDFHAVSAASNLLAAAIDTTILLDNPLEIVPESVSWKRVVDMNDRALRQIQVGLGGPKNGVPRESGFEITSASEVMAILGLARDLKDLRARLGQIQIGRNQAGKVVTAEDLGAAGAMAALLKDAMDPTIMQTTEGTLAFVHTGPFANIAHGNSSVAADRVARRYADYVVTEAGFGADMGAEKFCNIKCRTSGMQPDAALMVVTVRALKTHSNNYDVRPGRPLPEDLFEENLANLEAGCANLDAQLAGVRRHGIPVVVAINRFPSDSDAELELVRERALASGAVAAEISEVHGKGGAGGEAIAHAIVAAADSGSCDFKHLYDLEAGLEQKLETLAKDLYGADALELSPEAREQLKRIEADGGAGLPVCVAKTQYSLSHDSKLKGRPTGFTFPVRELKLAAGAGFVIAYAGAVMTMPGLGRTPAYRQVDLDDSGQIIGLF
ncbi:MAG: formate--tetrahydrofolate ligase [Planctomycetota bacterium]|jgi:formate--tetrahydrofolate ligase